MIKPSNGSLICTFADCPLCKDDPAWHPEHFCGSEVGSTFLSCEMTRFKGRCPEGFAP